MPSTASLHSARISGVGVPVGVIVMGKGSVGLLALIPSTDPSANWNRWVMGGAGPCGPAPGIIYARGAWEALVWDQGEDEASGTPANNPPTNYASNYKSLLLPGMRDLVGDPAMPTFMVQLGRGASIIQSSADVARVDEGGRGGVGEGVRWEERAQVWGRGRGVGAGGGVGGDGELDDEFAVWVL